MKKVNQKKHPGSVVVHTINRIKSNLFQHAFIDTYSKMTLIQLSTETSVLSTIYTLNKKFLPWYKNQNTFLSKIITDTGPNHPNHFKDKIYQSYLFVENIKLANPKKHQESFKIKEEFLSLITSDFYEKRLSKKEISPQEIQQDLDQWLTHYNQQKHYIGDSCYGRTPMETFLEDKIPPKNL